MVKNNYEIVGLENPETSPMVLLIHGAGGDLQHFKTVTPTLVEQGNRVLLLNVRYHGLSQLAEDENEDPEKIAWTFHDVLQDIDTMLQDVKKQHYQGTEKIQLFVGGLSMGGMITLLYAERYSQQENKEVELVGIIPIAAGVPHLEISRLGWDLYADRRATLEELEFTKSAIIQSSITPYGQEQTRRAIQLISNHALYECLVAIATMLPNPSDSPVPYKVATQLPTLLIISEQDVLTRPEMELLYQSSVEQGVDVEKTYIPDAGHMVILDQGQQVSNHIAGFCKRVFNNN